MANHPQEAGPVLVRKSPYGRWRVVFWGAPASLVTMFQFHFLFYFPLASLHLL